ncbi:hypothetical protein RN001_006350 [Aquatica leii]|uniref:Gustatory receptor n=1 Tax=Aquatica leii TaxID=1421715 RepID=A0AAN7PIF9_9COLE|nr:hypothetical protein RN001_006350 [Aquatica leii]
MNASYYPTTFYSILNPIFYFSKIFGLAPFTLKPTCYKKSKGNIIWCIILLIIYITIFICFNEEQNANAGFITALTAEVNSYCTQFGMWFAIILAIYFSNDLTAAIADIDKLDGPSLTNAVVALQFSSITWCLKRRFLLINNTVENMFNKIETCTLTIFSSTKIVSSDLLQDQVINMFENVREKHIELCNICFKINKCYSFQILVMVLQSFITIILAMYFGGKSLLGKGEVSIPFVIYCGNQMFLAIVQVVVLVLICSSTVAEARKTGDLIHNSLTYLEPCKNEMFLQASYFSLQLLHNNFDFTASGVITIDPSLLLEIVGAICTYLVIVVQFEISYPTKNC